MKRKTAFRQKLFYFLSPLIILISLIIGYFIYGYTAYYRLEDNLTLSVTSHTDQSLNTGKDYTISSFNIGYGAYPQDYSFFMDGGKYSRAYNRQTVLNNMQGIQNAIQMIQPDIALFQEIDTDGDRSQHVDEVEFITQAFEKQNWVFGQNYDSPYLFYPILDPIGKATSGLLTMSKYTIQSSQRYSLPIETNFNKFFDLDRAFTASYLPVSNQKQLALINIHLSAYTKDPTIGKSQLEKLFHYMESEYEKGNYVIVGGDFNHDILLGKSPEVFQTSDEPQTWTHPFPVENLSKHFTLATQGLAEQKIPSARALDEGYQKGRTFVTLVDGFIISDNVQFNNVQAYDLEFQHSDHNPVSMSFTLK